MPPCWAGEESETFSIQNLAFHTDTRLSNQEEGDHNRRSVRFISGPGEEHTQALPGVGSSQAIHHVWIIFAFRAHETADGQALKRKFGALPFK